LIDISVCQYTGLCLPPVLPKIGGDLANSAASAFLDVVASSLSLAAAWLVGHILALINLRTPDLTGGWFVGESRQMESVVELTVLPVLMAASLGAVLKQDVRRLGRVWAVGLPVAVLAGFAGPTVAELGLQATDQLSSQITPGGSGSLSGQLGHAVTAVASSGAPPFVQMIIFTLMIVGSVLIWLELLVRMSAVYLAVFFMPLALVGYIWPATAHLAKRVVEILAALILSKFVIIGALALGEAALRAKTGEGSLDGAITGSAILLIAAFAPFCVLRLAPVVEAAAIAHLEGMSRRPGQAATRAVTTAAATVLPAARVLMSAANRTPDGAGVGAAPGGSGGTSVLPQAIPERKADYPVAAGPGARDG
jgi:hypothetical protein